MTTLATIAGLAPLAFGIGAGAEIQRPLAMAVIGGLVVSTLVSLFVIPSLVRLAFRRSPPSSSDSPVWLRRHAEVGLQLRQSLGNFCLSRLLLQSGAMLPM